MPKIGTPIEIAELHLTPKPEGGIDLSDNMQQTLALLTAFWQNKRVVVKASPSGVLSVASARLKDILHFTGVGANDTQQGSDIPCTEVICKGHPDNTGKVWVRAFSTATTSNAWPLSADEAIGFTLSNLSQLQMLIVTDGEKLIVGYTD